jgi:predicted N-formylglutamate amidohydrolase
MKNTILITAEHGGNLVPDDYQHLFNDHSQLLQTHRGYDVGSWQLAEELFKANLENVKMFGTKVTRLLVDVNRSLWRRTLFSVVTKKLDKKEKNKILENYYHAYRQPIYNFVQQEISKGFNLIHLAVHSFTPVLNGMERNADIGLLYNPQRKSECTFSKEWKNSLKKVYPRWNIRFNYPYRGKPDGLTAHLRKLYPDNRYLGIEFEMNQKYAKPHYEFPEELRKKLALTFQETVCNFSYIR